MRAIFRATRETVTQAGLEAASLDAIAGRAGLTQAALRHYFPTRDDLLGAFFITAANWMRGEMITILTGSDQQARAKLLRCLDWHLQFMESVDTVFWLESSAYWVRHGRRRRTRDDWYNWLTGQYALLIGQMQPTAGRAERQRRAYLIVTLVLGAWITHGRGSAVGHTGHPEGRRKLLIETAMTIAEGSTGDRS